MRFMIAAAWSLLGAVESRADSCPTAKDEIATDRPDVTNSSLVVPTGSFQSENGINFSSRDGGRTLDGTNARWRIGIAPCRFQPRSLTFLRFGPHSGPCIGIYPRLPAKRSASRLRRNASTTKSTKTRVLAGSNVRVA
jgi:hypothetical protein